MNSSKHISVEHMADLIEQRFNSTEFQDASAHLSTCMSCATTFQRLENVFRLMSRDVSEDVPRDVLQRAVAVFQTSESTSFVRRVVAILSFDSLKTASAFGTRSGQATARQLIYSADDKDIDLHISTQDNNWVVSGQVLGATCSNAVVEIEGNNVSVSSALNESCEFKLSAVPSGDYHLRLRLSDIELEVPRLELRK